MKNLLTFLGLISGVLFFAPDIQAAPVSYVQIATTTKTQSGGFHTSTGTVDTLTVGTATFSGPVTISSNVTIGSAVTLSTITAPSSSGVQITGRSNGIAAAAGMFGEAGFSYNSLNPAFPASTVWLNIATSSVLTAGDWDLWANLQGGAGTPTPTLMEIAISTETGTANVMGQRGFNSTFISISSNTVATSGFGGFLAISTTTSASTTWYLRGAATYTGTAPNARGTIFWRRRS